MLHALEDNHQIELFMQENGGSCCINQANTEVQKEGSKDNCPAYGALCCFQLRGRGGGQLTFCPVQPISPFQEKHESIL